MVYETFDQIPRHRYGAIYADPPWHFKTWSEKGRGRSPKYKTAEVSDMAAEFPVGELAANDCALFLWGTWPMLPSVLVLMDKWGFTYKTVAFVWVKTTQQAYRNFASFDDLPSLLDKLQSVGCGYWTRANTEYCLLGTKGKPKRRSASVREVIFAPRREHSRKPDETYGLIEQLLGDDIPRIELFGRQEIPGWDVFGNEVGIFENDV